MGDRIQKITHILQHHYIRVVVFGVIGILCLFILMSIQNVYAPEALLTVDTYTATSSFSRSTPVRLVIPKIHLDTTFVEPLSLNTDKTVSVPDSYEEVGWYSRGVTPGEIGPAVILGHVDSREGPAVFYSLGQLKKGDEVSIMREDGTTAVFVVTEMERVPQDKFPTEKVYGSIQFAGLRLVTCTGIYDRGALRYSHNLIVYAELKHNPEGE